MKKTIAVLLICLTLFAFAGCENKENKTLMEAIDSFDNTVMKVRARQGDLSGKISEAENLLSSTDANELIDTSVLEGLKSAIESAKGLMVDIPEMTEQTEQINQQTDELSKQESALRAQHDSLDIAIRNVGTSKQALANRIAAEEEAKILTSVSPNNSHTYTFKTSGGYEIEVTLKIGSWIKASDTELLSRAWAAVGGSGDAPTAETFKTGYSAQEEFRSDRSVIAFGTISLKNLTNGYDITSEYPLDTKVQIAAGYHDGKRLVNYPAQKLGFWRLLVAYSSGTTLSQLQAPHFKDISARMVDNSWGPTPIAMAVSNVFNPNFPDGNPDLLEMEIIFGKSSFKIDKQW